MDTEITKINCDRCHTHFSEIVIMSWFTGELLCEQCKKDEENIRLSLPFNGENFKGCGYIPGIKLDIY